MLLQYMLYTIQSSETKWLTVVVNMFGLLSCCLHVESWFWSAEWTAKQSWHSENGNENSCLVVGEFDLKDTGVVDLVFHLNK